MQLSVVLWWCHAVSLLEYTCQGMFPLKYKNTNSSKRRAKSLPFSVLLTYITLTLPPPPPDTHIKSLTGKHSPVQHYQSVPSPGNLLPKLMPDNPAIKEVVSELYISTIHANLKPPFLKPACIAKVLDDLNTISSIKHNLKMISSL